LKFAQIIRDKPKFAQVTRGKLKFSQITGNEVFHEGPKQKYLQGRQNK